ncbi:hypothetical protein A9Q81_17325 [Gammaproteobacteria bacterium 42_54_T18]|nr:hypothetical protein A9Q81_17325 [Gammaproteobacteria bacterium 42_54_T18]
MEILIPTANVKNIAVRCGLTTCLNDVTFNIYPGEFCALIGPSGSGKSVLFEALLGFHHISAGTLSKPTKAIGLVPQKDELHENISPKEALKINASLRGITQEKEKLVQSVLQQVDLLDHQHKPIRKLSGGQKKRVSIALEFLSSSQLLLLDEPCASLDPQLELQQMQLFRELASQGRSILISTHKTHNLHFCHCLLVIYSGTGIFYGTPEQAINHFHVTQVSEIYGQLKKRSVRDWLSSYQAFERSHRFLSRSPYPSQHQPPSSTEKVAPPTQQKKPTKAEDILKRIENANT